MGSDFDEMSPSPEFPHSPVDTQHIESVLEEAEKANILKNKKMNFKWKSSVSKYTIHNFWKWINFDTFVHFTKYYVNKHFSVTSGFF